MPTMQGEPLLAYNAVQPGLQVCADAETLGMLARTHKYLALRTTDAVPAIIAPAGAQRPLNTRISS